MNNRSITLALHEMEGIGWATIRKLRQAYQDLEDLLGAAESDLERLGIRPAQCAAILRGLTPAYIEQTALRYADGRIKPVLVDDPAYPEWLKQIARPPWVLYTCGCLDKLALPSIAIVGTRAPTAYGRKAAEQLARDLSEAGVCVVSGLARGIDGAAHRGALQGKAGTIAVLGSGLDCIYPKEHTLLYHAICESGLAVSEYPPGTLPHSGLFPQRNRIIAGMTLGTLVVEASDRSGSLITAAYAVDASREVFAVPGPIYSPRSAGTNALIRQGAKLVTCAADLLAELAHLIQVPTSQPSTLPAYSPSLSAEEAAVYSLIADYGPLTIDELVERCQNSFGQLHTILLSLQIKCLIEQLPGSVYVKI